MTCVKCSGQESTVQEQSLPSCFLTREIIIIAHHMTLIYIAVLAENNTAASVQDIDSLPIHPPSPHTTTTTTYSFRFGEVHLDKAVVRCFIVCLYDELVSLVGDVLSQQRDEERHEGQGVRGEEVKE